MKWEDVLRRYAANIGESSWTELSGDRETWAEATEGFVSWYCGNSLL